MNCEEFRALIGAEPNSTNPEALAHAESCAECARYRQEMQDMDRLIYRALAIDVQAPAARPATRNTPKFWRMAASMLMTAGLVVLTSLWLLAPRETLAAAAIEHIGHERLSLVRTDHEVDAESLEDVLSASGVRLKAGAAHVSYAMSCVFRGHRIPHLVVQTQNGPVTVLVMPKVPRQDREEIDEGGFQGVILPAPQGVIVVLGERVPVDDVASTVLGAIEYL